MQIDVHEEIQKSAEAATPQETALRRRLCTFLQYWHECDRRACRRAHACAGEPTVCYLTRWLGLSETARIWADAGVEAAGRGCTARVAARAADRALLRHLRMLEGLPHYPPRVGRRRRVWRRPAAQEGEGNGDRADVRA